MRDFELARGRVGARAFTEAGEGGFPENFQDSDLTDATVNHLLEHLKAIVGDRSPFTAPEHLERVGRYIVEQFVDLGLQPVKETVTLDGFESFNVLAGVEGRNSGAPPVLIGAHYDSVPDCPGADDNASAVAALLEIGRCLVENPPAGPVTLVAFALEEYGFVGSDALVQRMRLENRSLGGMISLEMLGYTDRRPGSQQYPPLVDPSRYPDTGDFIAVVGNEPSVRLAQSVVAGMKGAEPGLGVESLVVPGEGDLIPDVRRSDHVPFWQAGYPAVMVTDTANFRNPHYHQPTDTLDTLDLEFLGQVTRGLAGFLQTGV